LAGAAKEAVAEGATIIWVDESAFYLPPPAVRTWAPRGQTPHLVVKQSKDHLSAMSGVTLDGRLFLQVRERSYDSAAVVGFLRVLLRKMRGKIILVWDGSPIHRGQPVKDFLRRGRSAAASGAVAWLCARPQSGRRRVELREAGGVGQCLLSRSGRAAHARESGTRTPAAQA
jgi:hypothetical protein